MTFERFISLRYFRSKPNQTIIALITLLSIAGVAIGVTALIVVIAVMGGFETDLKSRILGIEPHLIIEPHDGTMEGFRDVVRLCREHDGVENAWPVVQLQSMLRSDVRVTGAVIKGIDPVAAQKGLRIQSLGKLAEPAPSDNQIGGETGPAPPPIVIGADLARTLGVFKGDDLFIISPRGTLAPMGFVPFMKKFRVVDFFETGMYEYDGGLAFMRLADAQSLARMKSSVSAVEMRVSNIYRTNTIGKELTSLLGPSYEYKDWIKLNKNLFAALKLEKAAMFITLTLIILVATFSITSSLVMLVMEKTKDIAILKAMGAANRSVQKLFVYQGILIGSIGTSIGVLMGTMLCYLQLTYDLVKLPGDVYYITALPVNLRLIDVLLVATSALAICFLATLYPARQAARLNPVEAIRYGG